MPSLSLRGVLSLDGKGFDATIRNARSGAKLLGDQMGGSLKSQIATAFSIGAIVAFTNSLADAAGQIKDTAERLGATMGFVQEMGFAAERSGSNMEQFAGGLDRLARAMQDISSGGGEKALKALERYGMTFREIQDSSPEQVIKRLASAIEGLPVNKELTDDMMELFGKSGAKLIPVLKSLREESANLRGSFNFMGDREIELWDKAGDKLADFGNSLKLLGGRAMLFLTDSDLRADAINSFFQSDEETVNVARGFAADKARKELDANRPAKDLFGTASQEQLDDLARAEHQRAMDEVVDMQAKAAEINERIRQSQMTDEEKLNELLLKRAEIYAKLNTLQFAPGTKERAELDLELAQLNEKILQGSKTKSPEVASKNPNAIATDSFVRVGNFLGNGGSVVTDIARRQLDATREVAKNTKIIADRITKGGGTDSLDSATP